MEKIGHRYVIQYFNVKGLSPTNIKAELDSTLGDSVPLFKTIKVKAPIAGRYPIAGQSHEFFSKLEIYESLIAILVYRIQTSKRTL